MRTLFRNKVGKQGRDGLDMCRGGEVDILAKGC